MDELTARARVVAAAREWGGTPYHHVADVMGARCDCSALSVRVYRHPDLIDPVAREAGARRALS